MRRRLLTLLLLVAACGSADDVEPVDAPVAGAERSPEAGSDEAFEALQERGATPLGMRVDPDASTHQFDIRADGGRIELQYDTEAPAEIERIRDHLQEIARAFAAGDFSTPAFVHMQEVPGTEVMAARRDAIDYEYRALPRGGEIVITTADPQAREAIRRFIEFQRSEHRAGGHGH